MKTDEEMLEVAIKEAKIGLSEAGVPIGAALFDKDGNLLGKGHNKRVQDNDPTTHAETDGVVILFQTKNFNNSALK